mgnify:CR=1 FL=1
MVSVRSQQLAAIVALTGAAFAAEQARMAQIKARETMLRSQLASLDAHRQARAAGLEGAADTALRGGADPLWHQWIDRRRMALNGELLRVLAEQDRVRAALARAFGREQATIGLARAEHAATAQKQARRADHG